MGRKVLIAVLSWLTLNEITAKAVQTTYDVGLTDNVSAESASRLYRNVPVGVYASANPYASYSFQIPQFITPKVVPFKEERIVAQSTNNFLKDSYGQRFVEIPQSYAYKATLPQQFVPLQNLPDHLRQPLVAAAPSAQYGQATHFFGSAPFRLSNLQAFAPDHVNAFGAAQPLTYAENVRPLSAATQANQGNDQPVVQQQSTNNNNIYLNNLIANEYNKLRQESNIQTVEEPKKSASVQNEKQQQIVQKLPLVHAPKLTSITSVTNGKKTVTNFITKPPVPLLDLTLLEPLTFDNPLVPQVQHFLPRISQVTYTKLPDVNQVKNHKKVYVKTKSKTKTTKKKQRKQNPGTVTIVKNEVEVQKTPAVTVHELHDESPEITYEINSPNYKETISEKKVSYNKETQSKPVHISYEKKTQMKPVHYSYGHTEKPVHYSYTKTSNEPAQIKQAYENNNQIPKHLIYHFKPEENDNNQEEPQHNSGPQSEVELIDDKSNESDAETVLPQQQQSNTAQHELAEEAQDNDYVEPDDKQEVYYQDSEERSQPERREEAQYKNSKENTEPEYREKIYYENPKEIISEGHQRSSEPIAQKPSPKNVEKPSQAIVPDYGEEDIIILPTHKPHVPANAKINDNGDSNDKQNTNPVQKNNQIHYNYPESYHSAPPVTYEKSKRIIIKEESPQKIFTPNEELMEAMVKKQEESEEIFEKAYKDAAYGFPAYDSPIENKEKDIYNPDNYGAARFTNDFDVLKSPLRQYEAAGDIYPSYTRSNYKDARDKTSDKYYAEYAIAKPESLIDRYKQKENYYKNYKENMPQKYKADEETEEKESAKYIVAPSYSYVSVPQKKQKFAKYRVAPEIQGYSYDKEAPRDSSAFATRPIHRYKSKTQFVEPQFQYGFEPLMITRLLDSELAAMASNDSPESETTGIRKKIYKENFYIKKSNTGKAAR